MLTIKHIRIDGSEAIYQAFEVEFQPTPASSAVKTRSPIESAHADGSLLLTRPTINPGETDSYGFGLQGGTVFVMNAHGKTVSRYDLGASDVAFGVDPISLKAA